MKFHAIWMSNLAPIIELKYSCKVVIVLTSILLSWVLCCLTLYMKIQCFFYMEFHLEMRANYAWCVNAKWYIEVINV